MLKDALLVGIGLAGGLYIQQSAEALLDAAPLWLSIPVSIGGVSGFTLLFVLIAKRLMMPPTDALDRQASDQGERSGSAE